MAPFFKGQRASFGRNFFRLGEFSPCKDMNISVSSERDAAGDPGPVQRTAFAIVRRRQVEEETGYSRSTIYLRIAQGLWPKPVRLGRRAVGWPAREVAAINSARIAGKSDSEIRALVADLVGRRSVGATT